MNQLLIMAHAPLAQALRACAQHVFPDCAPRVVALDVQPGAVPEQTEAEARQLLAENPAGNTLVLTDIFGATPCNVAQRLSGPGVRVVAGVNLPMLLRALTYCDQPLDTLVTKVLSGGAQGVMPVGGGAVPIQSQHLSIASHDSEHHHHQQ